MRTIAYFHAECYQGPSPLILSIHQCHFWLPNVWTGKEEAIWGSGLIWQMWNSSNLPLRKIFWHNSQKLYVLFITFLWEHSPLNQWYAYDVCLAWELFLHIAIASMASISTKIYALESYSRPDVNIWWAFFFSGWVRSIKWLDSYMYLECMCFVQTKFV